MSSNSSQPGALPQPMILYAAVSNGRSLLAEHSERELPDTIPTSTRALLAKIGPESAPKMSYTMGEYVFHYVLDDGVTFLCMTHAAVKWRIAFAYLEEIRNRFNYSYPGCPAGTPSGNALFAQQADFGPVLRDQVSHAYAHFARKSAARVTNTALLPADA